MYAEDVAASHNVQAGALDSAFDQLTLRNPRAMLAASLLDAVEQGLLFEDYILSNTGKDEEEVQEVSLGQYYTDKILAVDEEEEHIAIVYAQGSIVDGKGSREIGGDKFADIFNTLRKNEKVKGVVLRINSGGSALASEVMWQEINALSEVKPLIISVGDVAAQEGTIWLVVGITFTQNLMLSRVL